MSQIVPSYDVPTVRSWRRWFARLLVRSALPFARHTERFAVAASWKRERISQIAEAFLTGYNAMVLSSRPIEVRPALEALPRFFRPFAYEGAAMGLGAWLWLQNLGWETFEGVMRTVNPGTLYQHYVGLGWWLDLWVRHPSRIEAIVSRLDPRYRLIVYEGIGFRRGFLRPFRPEVARNLTIFAETARHVCAQGYGRSLWFTFMDNLLGAFAWIDHMPPDIRGDCYSGIGLGAAYSMLDRFDVFENTLVSVPRADRPDFLQGAAFGWEARQLADRPYFDAQLAKLPESRRQHVTDCVRIVHSVQRQLEEDRIKTEFYQRWRKTTRALIAAQGLFAPGDSQ